MTPERFAALMSHPMLQLSLGVLLCSLLSLAVGLQLRRSSLDDLKIPGLPAFRWSRLASLFTLLFCLLLLTPLVLGGISDLLLVAGQLLARLGAAMGCLLVAAWVARVRGSLAEELPRAEQQEALRQQLWVWTAGGLAAVATLVSSGSALVLLVMLGMLLVFGLFSAGEPAKRARELLQDLVAGIDLRARLHAGQELDLQGERLRLLAAPGLLGTSLDRAGASLRLRNTVLLGRLPPVVLSDRPGSPE